MISNEGSPPEVRQRFSPIVSSPHVRPSFVVRVNVATSHMDSPTIALVDELRPTQLAVGMQEVRQKATVLAGLSPKKLDDFLAENAFAIVKGPGGDSFIIDRHHLACALHEIGVRAVYSYVLRDYSYMSTDQFWAKLAKNEWVRPIDEYGRPHPYGDIPCHVYDLGNDVYRSLAGALLKSGDVIKTRVPYAEFAWADFLREKVPRLIVESDMPRAVSIARPAVHSEAAAHLPGYQPGAPTSNNILVRIARIVYLLLCWPGARAKTRL